MLLVHGYLVNHRCWDAVIEPLSRGFTVIAPDLPGAGDSDCPSRFPYTRAAYARVMAGLLQSLGIERAAVLGHSMGGGIALALAAQYPARVERLVLADPLVYFIRLPIEGRLAMIPLVGELLFKKLYSPRDLRRYFRREVYLDPSLATEELIQRCWVPFERAGGREAAYRALRSFARLESLADLPPRVDCPVQLIRGEHDRIVPLSDVDRLRGELRHASFTSIAGSGHAPMEERPAQFCEAVLPFLSAERA